MSAVITGVDEDVIHRFGITLKVSSRENYKTACEVYVFVLCIVPQLCKVNQQNSLSKLKF